MNDCLFCKIAAGEIPAEKIYEDSGAIAFLDINPINPGHTLIIPKEHYRNIFEMPDETLSQIAPLVKKISEALKESLDADGINIGMNNEPAAGQEVFHAHIHIMPRYENDGYKMWHGKPYKDKDEIKVVASKIESSLK
jgi:histidine triad (HIT) family protein